MKLWFALFTVAFAADWKDQAVIHLDRPPQAQLKAVPVRAVTEGPLYTDSDVYKWIGPPHRPALATRLPPRRVD